MKRPVRQLLPLAAFIFAATAAMAADDGTILFPAGSTVANPPTVGGSLGSVTLLLGLALAAVGGWLVWRARRIGPASREARQLAVSETRSLGNRQFLVVASWQDKKFLLGVCPGRIDLLAPLDEAPGREKPRA